jgi:hypothetical protein
LVAVASKAAADRARTENDPNLRASHQTVLFDPLPPSQDQNGALRFTLCTGDDLEGSIHQYIKRLLSDIPEDDDPSAKRGPLDQLDYNALLHLKGVWMQRQLLVPAGKEQAAAALASFKQAWRAFKAKIDNKDPQLMFAHLKGEKGYQQKLAEFATLKEKHGQDFLISLQPHLVAFALHQAAQQEASKRFDAYMAGALEKPLEFTPGQPTDVNLLKRPLYQSFLVDFVRNPSLELSRDNKPTTLGDICKPVRTPSGAVVLQFHYTVFKAFIKTHAKALQLPDKHYKGMDRTLSVCQASNF